VPKRVFSGVPIYLVTVFHEWTPVRVFRDPPPCRFRFRPPSSFAIFSQCPLSAKPHFFPFSVVEHEPPKLTTQAHPPCVLPSTSFEELCLSRVPDPLSPPTGLSPRFDLFCRLCSLVVCACLNGPAVRAPPPPILDKLSLPHVSTRPALPAWFFFALTRDVKKMIR